MKKTLKQKYTIHTVKSAIRILKLFSKDKPEWSLSEIANELNINISKASRLVKTLVEYEYLHKNSQTKRYRLGLMIINLSGIITTTMEIQKEAKPIMEDYAQKLGNAIHLGILEGTEIVYLDKVEPKNPIRLNSHIGKRNPSYCTACGKIMLAYQRKEKLDKILNTFEKNGFRKYGINTVENRDELLKQLEEIRNNGFAICIDEFFYGISIGAPVYNNMGEVIAALSVTGRNIHKEIPYLTEQIIEACEKLSRKLGYYNY